MRYHLSDYTIIYVQNHNLNTHMEEFEIPTYRRQMPVREYLERYGESTAYAAVMLKRRDIWYPLLEHVTSVLNRRDVRDSATLMYVSTILYYIVEGALESRNMHALDDVRYMCSNQLLKIVEREIAEHPTYPDPHILDMSVEELKSRAFVDWDSNGCSVRDVEAAVRYIDICADDELPIAVTMPPTSVRIRYRHPLTFNTMCDRRRHLIGWMNVHILANCITNHEHIPLTSRDTRVVHQAVTSRRVRNMLRAHNYKIGSCNIDKIDPDECDMIHPTYLPMNPHMLHPLIYDRFHHIHPQALSRTETIRLMIEMPEDYIPSVSVVWHRSVDISRYMASQALKHNLTGIVSMQLAIAIHDVDATRAMKMCSNDIQSYLMLL